MTPLAGARTIMTMISATIALALAPIVYAAEAVGGQGTSDPMLEAALWLQDTLAGEIAATLAVLAVCATGFAVLTERLDWRAGLSLTLGCSLLLALAAVLGGARG